MCDSKCCAGGHGHGCTLSFVCKVLLIVGGINWGLVGVGMLVAKDWNVVNMIFGTVPTLEAAVYILVGVAALLRIFHCKCKKCVEACAGCGTGEMNKEM